MLATILTSCSDEPIVKARVSEYILIGDSRQGIITSNVARFNATTKRVTEDFDVDFWIRDAIIEQDFLYAFEATENQPGVLWRINLNTMSVETSVELQFSDVFTTFLEAYNDNILVFGISDGMEGTQAILSTYSQELEKIDEVNLGPATFVTEVLVVDDLLFLSLTYEGGESVIKVLDLNTFNLLDEFSLGTFLTAEFQIRGNLVYAFEEFGFHTINRSNLTKSFFEEDRIDIGLEKSPSVTFGETDNFYFLDALSQPSAVPFQVSEYSLMDNESQILINELGFIVNFPISYDTINNVLLLNGGRRLLKVTTANGFNQIDVSLPFEDLLFILPVSED